MFHFRHHGLVPNFLYDRSLRGSLPKPQRGLSLSDRFSVTYELLCLSTPLALPFFSTTSKLPNFQVLCFDNDATVGDMGVPALFPFSRPFSSLSPFVHIFRTLQPCNLQTCQRSSSFALAPFCSTFDVQTFRRVNVPPPVVHSSYPIYARILP